MYRIPVRSAQRLRRRSRQALLTAALSVTALCLVGALTLPIAASPAEPPADTPNEIRAQSTPSGTPPELRRRLHPRTGYSWNYSQGPYYGVEADSSERESPRTTSQPGLLFSPVGSFDLTRPGRPFPEALLDSGSWAGRDRRYFLVQLHPDLAVERADEVRRLIEAHGGRQFERWPVEAVLARLDPSAEQRLLSTPGILAVEPFHPAFKLHPTIGRLPHPDPRRAASELYLLEARLFPGEDAAAAAAASVAIGAKVVARYPDSLILELHRDSLAALAGIDSIRSVIESFPVRLHAEETTSLVQAGFLTGTANPFHDAGVDGSGGGVAGTSPQVLMVLDSGIQLDAGDLSDTRTSAGTPGPGHRKVRLYTSTAAFGTEGGGDGLGCDDSAQGGQTHGHTVSATALGNATAVDVGSYGAGWLAEDPNNPGNFYALDGVAPGAVLAAYDAQQTPASGNCGDPLLGTFAVGDLYSGTAQGSMADAYDQHDARIFNFSWGVDTNAYDSNTQDIDNFLSDGLRPDALVFISVGNSAGDANNDNLPDPGSVGAPGTTKNGVSMGSSGNLDDSGNPFNVNERSPFSSVGPAGATGRIAPLLMAPGEERGFSGIDSEFSCRSSDNDSLDPVECDLSAGQSGTSFSSPAAAGAALLVRDYFAQGFFPDGTSSNPGNAADQLDLDAGELSGAAVKAVLIASAEMLGRNFSGQTGLDGLAIRHRFNREQGYGRVQLDRALPLQNWPNSPTGLLVADGAVTGGANNLGLTGLVTPSGAGAMDTTAFEICDPTQELRVALVWMDPTGDSLVNDLHLTLTAPGGKQYWGNYFTDDNNRNNVNTTFEDCPGFGGEIGEFDASAWSLPSCANSIRDITNPTEAIFLSPDPDGNNLIDDGRLQTEAGVWQLQVEHTGGAGTSSQSYALIVSGGVCQGSSVRLDSTDYVCNGAVEATVTESDDPADPGVSLSPAEISNRTRMEVVAFNVCNDKSTACEVASDCNGVGGGPCNPELVVDSETNLSFTQPEPAALSFRSTPLLISYLTAYDVGNGVLDARDGNQVRVVYQDEDGGQSAPGDLLRTSTAGIDCSVDLEFGSITFGQFGQNTTFDLVGGCERNARGLFEFGFPDLYMDATESLSYRFAFASSERGEMLDVEASLRCVRVDSDSPAGCLPDSDTCPDPNRLNNADCSDLLTVTDTPKIVGSIPPGAAMAANFTVEMAGVIAGSPKVEMVLELKSLISGKSGSALAINRHTLNVDEVSLFYSTDFPQGGVEFRDVNNNDLLEVPTTSIGDFDLDYRFETRTWSDLTAGGTINLGLQSPWNFDNNDGGFRSGIGSATDDQSINDIIAQWGEDKDFNGVLSGRCVEDPGVACNRFPIDAINCPTTLDPGSTTFDRQCTNLEDRDPVNSPIPLLDQNWSTLGGCGWQTQAPNTCSGDPNVGCYDNAQCTGIGTCTGPAPDTGGVWHTGKISDRVSSSGNPNNCLFTGNNDLVGDCQAYETISGTDGTLLWFETLLTPEIGKVNTQLDGDGEPVYRAQILNWAWNQAIDLPDNNVGVSWEFDTDTARFEPSDLVADLDLLNFTFGPFGAVTNGGNPDLADGFSVFAPIEASTGESVNGTVGNSRDADNACFFEGVGTITTLTLSTLGIPGPPDDDATNGWCDFGDGDTNASCTFVCDTRPSVLCTTGTDCVGTCSGDVCSNDPTRSCTVNGQCNFGGCVDADPVCDGATCVRDSAMPADVDRYVRSNGPIRNMDISAFNGPDMRFSTLEDLYGATAFDWAGWKSRAAAASGTAADRKGN